MTPASGRGSILILSPWPSIFSMGGGGTPRGRDLIDTLLEAGYTVDFVAPRAPTGDWVPELAGLRLHRYGPLRVTAQGYSGRVIRWLERTIRITASAVHVVLSGDRPQAIYAWSSLTVPAAVCCSVLVRRPTIGALFGTFLYPHLGSRRGRIGNFEEIVAFKSPVDRLLITNDGTRGDEVARILGVPDSRVRFWMNGIDLEACAAARQHDARAELGLPPNVPLVVWSSRLVAWKRVDRLLRSVPDVLAELPDTVFAIAGEGDERPALEELARQLGVDHAVRFLGGLPRDVNLRLIASADVFSALYDYSCVGVALLDALACGAAVVVADTGATRDFVEDGVNGLVVRADDTAGTSAAIVRLLSDGELRARLGHAAQERAEERFVTLAQRSSLELQTIAELARLGPSG
jgi:glycosyltransferase involved in cell wall biosynthesis